MDTFRVNQEPDSLLEYHEEVVSHIQAIEDLALSLENHPDDLSALLHLRDIFQKLWVASTKLELLPIGENLKIIVQAFDHVVELSVCPSSFSDLLLLLTDEFMAISQGVIESSSVDMLAIQKIHVALQCVVLANNASELEEGVARAISQFSMEDADTEAVEVIFFDDEEDLTVESSNLDDSAVASESEHYEDNIQSFSLESINVSSNPISEARWFMASKSSDPFNALADMADLLTNHGNKHTMYLQEISLAMNIMLGKPVNPDDLWLGLALHDIGLAPMSERLRQPTPFSQKDIEQLKRHPVKGVLLAKRMGVVGSALNVIEQHHERIDGKGYPHALLGQNISPEGRIAAIADAFHSMISQRPHTRNVRRNLLDVVTEISNNSGTQFDSHMVKIFIKCLKDYWAPRHVIKEYESRVVLDFEV